MALLTRPITWDEHDSNLAAGEGWNIFDCDGSDNGPVQICVIEEPYLWGDLPFEEKQFDTDDDVWVYVWTRHKEGSVLHSKALEFIWENNPKEYTAIIEYVAKAGKL